MHAFSACSLRLRCYVVCQCSRFIASQHPLNPIPPILHQQAAQLETEDELKWATTAMAFWHLPSTVSLSKSGGLNLQQDLKSTWKQNAFTILENYYFFNSIEIQFLPIVQSSPDWTLHSEMHQITVKQNEFWMPFHVDFKQLVKCFFLT